MRLIDADALIEAVEDLYEYAELDEVLDVIKNAPTVKPQKIVTIPPELIEKLGSCVVNIIEKIDWDKAIEAYKERPHGKWLHPYKTDIACECSNCHMQMPITDYFNFCPNCGADMREDSDK